MELWAGPEDQVQVDAAFNAMTSKGLDPGVSLRWHNVPGAARIAYICTHTHSHSYKLDRHPSMSTVRCLVCNPNLPIQPFTALALQYPTDPGRHPMAHSLAVVATPTQSSQILELEQRITEAVQCGS